MRWTVGVLAGLALVGAGAAVWLARRPVPDAPDVAAAELAGAWQLGNLPGAPFDDDAPADLDAVYDDVVAGLDAGPPRVRVVAVSTPAQGAGDEGPAETAAAELAVRWDLGDARTWAYNVTAELARAHGELTWTVAWDRSLIHPRLVEGVVLGTRRTTTPRADVRAEDGSGIVTIREVVDVGVEPARVEDLERLVSDLTAELATTLAVQVDGPGLAQRVRDATENAFVDVVTLRDDDFVRVAEVIQPLPGTVFRRRAIPLAPTRGFARFTLGTAGPVTAEMLEEQPTRHVAGDIAGRSGLQEAYDERLFGVPGLEIVLVGEEAPEDDVLYEDVPLMGEPVTVTLDPDVQRAADEAVEGTGFASAMAVVRVSDGHVLALANSTEATFDIARLGQLPPGSTFKFVTTEALLADAGVTTDTPIDCPNAVTVAGRTITNAETQQLGTVPFRTAFANSCNTAFVQLSQQLGPGSLATAGAQFGLGVESSMGMPAFLGEVQQTGDAVDLAATAIGQGRTLVSPLAMAGAAATVAGGVHPGFSLVLEPDPGPRDEVPAIDPADAATIADLMRGVVVEGTGTLLASAPGAAVHGKTGTAEFTSSDGELRTHAWFVGFQGDLAFAVVVTDTPGRYGGEVAAPIALRFLQSVADLASPGP